MKSRTLNASPGYQLFMLVLCVYALAALAVSSVAELDPEINAVLEYADLAVCAVFFADFLYTLWAAEDRMKYLLTWGWLDLLSSFPMLDAARWGRIGRVMRVFRVLRGLRATRLVTAAILRRRVENSVLAVSMAAILLVVFCSVAILQFERTEGANIQTAEDAIWWSFVTITTVGYGDRYPVTTEGRLVAAVLMSAGVGLFGTFSGLLAAWLLKPGEQEIDTDLVSLRREIAALREAIERLEK